MKIVLPNGYFFWHITVNPDEIDLSEHCLKCLIRKTRFTGIAGIGSLPIG